MVAAGRDRHRAGRAHRRRRSLDLAERIHEVDRVDRRVAEIADADEIVGRDAG